MDLLNKHTSGVGKEELLLSLWGSFLVASLAQKKAKKEGRSIDEVGSLYPVDPSEFLVLLSEDHARLHALIREREGLQEALRLSQVRSGFQQGQRGKRQRSEAQSSSDATCDAMRRLEEIDIQISAMEVTISSSPSCCC